MTPRDHYNKLIENIDGCKAQYALLKGYEAGKIKDITDSLSIICDELKQDGMYDGKISKNLDRKVDY